MIKESIVELISAIADGNTLAIEDSFNSVMASKISDRLDSMRVDVAQGMFGSVDESYDSSDAYETWDPKHPKFKDKLIKHHAKGGTTQSFIDQEKAKAKKKLTREEVELYEAVEIGKVHHQTYSDGSKDYFIPTEQQKIRISKVLSLQMAKRHLKQHQYVTQICGQKLPLVKYHHMFQVMLKNHLILKIIQLKN